MNPFHNEVSIADGYYVFTNGITGRNKLIESPSTEQFLMMKSSPCWTFLGYFEDMEDAYETMSVVTVMDELKNNKVSTSKYDTGISKELSNARKKVLEFKDIKELSVTETLFNPIEEKQKKLFELNPPSNTNTTDVIGKESFKTHFENELKDLSSKYDMGLEFIKSDSDIPSFKLNVGDASKENVESFLNDVSKLIVLLNGNGDDEEQESHIKTILLPYKDVPSYIKTLIGEVCFDYNVTVKYLDYKIELDTSKITNLNTFLDCLLEMSKKIDILENGWNNNDGN